MLHRHLWIQFACFLVSALLMVELNNRNALIRVYSRMVAAAYIVLTCAACSSFADIASAVIPLCAIASFLTLFNSYQDKGAAAWVFYSFLFLGIASMADVTMLFYVPLLWFLMLYSLASMSGRTFMASIIGLLTPYWFAIPYFLFTEDFATPIAHFSSIASWAPLHDISMLGIGHAATLSLILILALTGIIHYQRTRFNDKIRNRMLFDCFMLTVGYTVALIVAEPRHLDALTRLLIVSTSPLIAHFIALTSTKITNAAFLAIMAACVAVTLLNLYHVIWTPL